MKQEKGQDRKEFTMKYWAIINQGDRFIRVLVRTNKPKLAKAAASIFNAKLRNLGRKPGDEQVAVWGEVQKFCPFSHAPCEFFKTCCEEGTACYIKSSTPTTNEK